MLQSILLAVDKSASSQVAAHYASYLAAELGAVLNILHVDDTRQMEFGAYRMEGSAMALAARAQLHTHEMAEMRRHDDELLSRIKAHASTVGVSCRIQALEGVPAREILAATTNSDIVVLGRRGCSQRTHPSGRLGEVIEKVLHHATKPVLLAGTEFESFRRILLGFDGGKAAHRVMLYAMELAKLLALPIMAVCVHTNSNKARHQLDSVEHYAAAHGLQVVTRVAKGHPVQTLLDMAEEDDLLTIGSFGEGRLHEWLLGSTTTAMLRSASQAILLHR